MASHVETTVDQIKFAVFETLEKAASGLARLLSKHSNLEDRWMYLWVKKKCCLNNLTYMSSGSIFGLRHVVAPTIQLVLRSVVVPTI